MLTDAASIVLALWAINLAARPAQGRWTYGFKRAEILSAQANGLTLLLLAAWFIYEAIRRLFDPPEVQGLLVFITAMVGIVINIAAAWLISKANRTSLNVEGRSSGRRESRRRSRRPCSPGRWDHVLGWADSRTVTMARQAWNPPARSVARDSPRSRRVAAARLEL